MGSSKKKTVGYKYFAGVLVGVALRVDTITELIYGEKTAWTGAERGGGVLDIDAEELHGGTDGEGGIKGQCVFLYGYANQPQSQYLREMLETEQIPSWRGLACLLFEGCYWGTSPYPKMIQVMAQRIYDTPEGTYSQWYPERAGIPHGDGTEMPIDMNPIHIIRECIVDVDGGMGYWPDSVDDANFRAAANVLFAEGLGLSFEWTGDESVTQFVDHVLQVIDAKYYVHPATGKFTIKLIRDDYDIGDLPTLGPAHIKEVTDYARPIPTELVTSVTVKYWDYEARSDGSVTRTDTAATLETESVISVTVDYPGITYLRNAERLAERDLHALSTPLLSARLVCRRLPVDLMPGDPFLFDWPTLHADPIVMRVESVDEGDSSSSEVIIACVEDVFATSAAAALGAYTEPVWQDPASIVAESTTGHAVEAPYWELVQRYGELQTDDMLERAPDGGMLLVAALRSSGAKSAVVYTDGSAWRQEADLMPEAGLYANIAPGDTDLPVDMWPAPVEGTHLQIGEEIVRVGAYVETSSGGRYTCGRGCLDTVAAAHTAGTTTVVYWDAAAVTDEYIHTAGETVSWSVAARNNRGIAPQSVPEDLTFNSRAIRPYPPGLFRINGEAYPTAITGPDLVVTWAHRSRLLQTAGAIIDESEGDIGPEPGTTYNVRIYDASDNLLDEATGLTGTTYTWTPGAPVSPVRVLLESMRDGYTSWQAHNWTIEDWT